VEGVRRKRIRADARRSGWTTTPATTWPAPTARTRDEVLAAVRADPSLGARIVAGRPYVWAEVRHAVRSEMALTLDDLLIRRMHLFYEARDGALSVARAVAERMAAEEGIGWDEAEIERQVERYRAAVEETRGFRPRAAA
jgi:glycerol-3-phosphate dehydrogenase